MPTFGSLFAGIGGIDLGLERAGWECRWQVEIDPFCQLVLERHWPDITRYGDIRQVHWPDVEPVDLVAGGFPCQPVSTAGRRKAQEDPRWLWPEFARCLRELRPEWALLENVRGLLQRGLADVLGDLAELGFDAEWGLLPACAVGAPHPRPRVLVVAHAHGGQLREQCRRGGRASREGAPQSLFAGADAWREAEPDLCGVADGLPPGVDRLRALGNAVVPQVAEWVGRRILEVNDALPPPPRLPESPGGDRARG